jgi:hypothetical protein
MAFAWMVKEIRNGGFAQWLTNMTTRDAPTARQVATSVGIAQMAAFLAQGIACMGPECPPDVPERGAIVEHMDRYMWPRPSRPHQRFDETAARADRDLALAGLAARLP